MKVDLTKLKNHVEGEIKSFERRIAALQDQIKQIDAVSRIAERIEIGEESSEPVDKALEKLKNDDGEEDVESETMQAFAEAEKTDGSDSDKEFDWAFQQGEK